MVESSTIEVWGGAECTRNRVRNRYFDQLDLSGHLRRPGDLDRFAELGIRALRCGLVWERHCDEPSWKREDAYLHRIRALGMRPIAGLLHHGSGPRSTSLIDPHFPEKLAAYARDVAERYPWIDAYTPINEPHTTARFACRYGLWYPHHMSDRSFIQALLLQMKAVVLSMRAIREVRPDAQLVQTDDFGKAYATRELQSVADYLNERRWLPFDLLAGVVDRSHSLFERLRDAGASEEQILWFEDNPCPADVIGVNYYVTSDRFLDHRIDLYPEGNRSAEGSFIDVEAVRVCADGIQGFEAVLHEAAERYRQPVAITELHLGGHIEEQLRWAAQGWAAACRAQAAGVPVRAVTFWALLGSYFWDRLVTTDKGSYESGVFMLQGGVPVPTALAEFVRQCASGETLLEDEAAAPGWWQLPERLHFDCAAELSAA